MLMFGFSDLLFGLISGYKKKKKIVPLTGRKKESGRAGASKTAS